MQEMIKEEFTIEKIEESYKSCCGEIVSVVPELERITQGIDDLCDLVSSDLVQNCVGMEAGFKEKCAEIKKIKNMIRKSITPKTYKEYGIQCDEFQPLTLTNITVKKITNTVDKPIVKEKLVEKIVYKDVVNQVIQVETTYVDKVVEIENVVLKEVEKKVNVNVEKVQIKVVDKIKEI